MARGVDEAKWTAWRERLARYEQSGQTIAAFCGAEGVSAPAFFQWRRKLSALDRRGSTTLGGESTVEPPTFLPVRLDLAEAVEIELPNGARIRLSSRDLAAISAA